MIVDNGSVKVVITDPIKTSQPGKPQPVVTLSPYSEDKALCVIRTLSVYIKRTKAYRYEKTKLFLSYVPPFKEVCTATISRWLKEALSNAGIDTSVFKAHSVRAASTSAAADGGVPIDTILRTAGWTNAGTFAKFYHRSTHSHSDSGRDENAFANSVLATGGSRNE